MYTRDGLVIVWGSWRIASVTSPQPLVPCAGSSLRCARRKHRCVSHSCNLAWVQQEEAADGEVTGRSSCDEAHRAGLTCDIQPGPFPVRCKRVRACYGGDACAALEGACREPGNHGFMAACHCPGCCLGYCGLRVGALSLKYSCMQPVAAHLVAPPAQWQQGRGSSPLSACDCYGVPCCWIGEMRA